MGSQDNRNRGKWQHHSGEKAGLAEDNIFAVFQEYFYETEFVIVKQPSEFNNIYTQVTLSPSEMQAIYNPLEPITRHGIYPDYSIRNNNTNKTIYVESKRQDGWVEGGTRADGRGNAHERLCKYFTPGLIQLLQKQGNLGSYTLPFWVIFQGNITRDPCRVREITFWFGRYTGHYFFWRNTSNPTHLINHFDRCIKPLLE